MNLGEWDNGEHLGLTGGGDTILECTVWKKPIFNDKGSYKAWF